MAHKQLKRPIKKFTKPFERFMSQEKSGGIVLGVSVIIALIWANSPWADTYFSILQQKFGFIWDGREFFNLDLLHWINDGLMAIFFFVVGLELKREIVGGELSHPRKAMLPIMAALGGMVVPALIYLVLNPVGEVHQGWGIPMATDIAFAIGVLYLLGNRVPLGLKIFLLALAIIDDLGAVLVIAIFYTSELSIASLVVGFLVLLVLYIGKRLGIRNVWFYAVLGIGGVWSAFLMSGVHATIAAVLVAFLIPAEVGVSEPVIHRRIKSLIDKFRRIDPNDKIPNLTHEQHSILEKIRETTNEAIPPLQKLEHSMHPIVNFGVLPIFALANAGVSLAIEPELLFSTNVMLGVGLGLLVGKVIGVAGATLLAVKLGIAQMPKGMNIRNLIGLSFIAAIGFTMSLFITSLAFKHELYTDQAKIGIFVASILGGILGYYIIKKSSPLPETENKPE